MEIKSELGDRKGVGDVLNNIANIFFINSEYPTALEYFEMSLEISRELGDRSGESISLLNIGSMYYEIAEFPKALKYYEE